MTLKNFFLTNAIIFVPFGLGMLLVPTIVFPLFGILLDPDGELMARVFGSALLNLGLICFLVRSEANGSPSIRAILVGNFLFHAFDSISTFIAAYNGVMNSMGWMFSSLHFALAVGFFYFLISKND